MLKEKKKNNFFDRTIDLIFIAFFTAHYLLPSFYFNFIIPLGLALVYCIYISIVDKRISTNLWVGLFIIAFLAFVYTLLTDTKTIASSVENGEIKQFLSKFNQYLMMYFPLVITYRITRNYPRKIKFIILLAISAVFLYVFGKTYMELLENPGATRHWDDFSGLAGQDIGSYDFVYAVPIMICVVATCIKKFNTIGKIVSMVAIGIMFVFLVNAEYTIALLISMLGIVMVVYCGCKKSLSKVMCLGFCFIGMLFLPNLIKLLYTKLPISDITYRLKEIYSFLVSGNADGYNLNGRLSLYKETLLAFIRSPISGNQSLDFDGHGTFITILSDTGLLGAIPMYGLLLTARRSTKETLGKHNKMFSPVFISFVLMGIVNPIHATDTLSFAMWCLAPLILDYFFNKEDPLNETSLKN